MPKTPKKMTTTANGAVVTGQEDITKLKNLTPKSAQNAEKCVESVDLPAEKGEREATLDELVLVSQEMGEYDVDSVVTSEDNIEVTFKDGSKRTFLPPKELTEGFPNQPLFGDTSTTSQEATEGVSMELQEEINTTVAPEANIAQNASQGVTEASSVSALPVGITISEPTNDAQTVKNGWGLPLPTKVVTIKKSYLRETVEEALYIANLGGALDTTFLPSMTCPFICRMLLPESKYQEYLERKSQYGYNESQVGGYNEVLVKGVDRPTFWKNLVKVGNTGGFLLPNSQPTRAPQFTAKLLTRNPVLDTIDTKLKPKKAIYTREELESFSIEDMHIIGGWFDLSFNSKQKYVKAILDKQEIQNAK